MKMRYFLGLAMLLALAGSCKKDEIKDPSEFTASIEIDEGDSKTYLDGYKVRWNAGDQMRVFGNGTGNYTIKDGEGTQWASFTGSGVQATETYRGFYPVGSSPTCSGDVFTFTMPANQTYRAGGFANHLNPMAGKSDGNYKTVIRFKNAFAILKLQTKGNVAVSKVEVTVPSGKYVYGQFTFDRNSLTTTYVSGGGQTVTLDCSSNPVTLNSTTDQDFYIVLPPGSIDNGFDVKYYQTGSATPFFTQNVPSTASNLTLARNTIKKLSLTAMAPIPQVTNLVPEMSSSWTVNYHTNANGPVISAAANTYDSNNNGASISFNTGTASGWNEAQVFAPGTVHLINGHKYYLRWCTRCSNVTGGSNSVDWRDSNHEVWFLGSSNVNWIVSTGENAPNGEQIHINKAGHYYSAAGKTLPTKTKGSWQMNSAYRTFTGATGDYQFRIDINNRQYKFGAEIACVMLIDLTADYTGASIPSFNTCDNRSYFIGSEDRDGINW